jgi:hypothetical protein
MTVGETFLVIGAGAFGLYVVWKLAGPAPAGASTASQPIYPTNTPFPASAPAGLPGGVLLPPVGGSPPMVVTPGGAFIPVGSSYTPTDAQRRAHGVVPGSNLARALSGTGAATAGLVPTPPLSNPFDGPVTYRGPA